MSTIRNILRKVEKLDFDEVIEKTFTKSSKEMVAENQIQLFSGLNRDGKRLKSYKNRYYAKRKYLMNPLPGLGNPDLYVTGRFFKGMKMKVFGKRLHFESSDKKGPDLEKKYSKIYGLGGKFKKEFVRETLLENFIDVIKTKVKL